MWSSKIINCLSVTTFCAKSSLPTVKVNDKLPDHCMPVKISERFCHQTKHHGPYLHTFSDNIYIGSDIFPRNIIYLLQFVLLPLSLIVRSCPGQDLSSQSAIWLQHRGRDSRQPFTLPCTMDSGALKTLDKYWSDIYSRQPITLPCAMDSDVLHTWGKYWSDIYSRQSVTHPCAMCIGALHTLGKYWSNIKSRQPFTLPCTMDSG